MSTPQHEPVTATTLAAEELGHLQQQAAEAGRPPTLGPDGLPQGFDPWWNAFDHPLHHTDDEDYAEAIASRALTLIRRALTRSDWQITPPRRLAFDAAVDEALETRLLSRLPSLPPLASGGGWRPAAIRGDWMQPEAVSYLGWIMDGQRWNGWVIPRFPATEVRRMIEENDRELHGQLDADRLRIVADDPGLPLIVEMHRPVYASDADYEPVEYVEDDHGTLSVGAMTWTWQEDEESATAARLRVRQTEPIVRRGAAAAFFRACARVFGPVFELNRRGDVYLDSDGAQSFGHYDAEVYDARLAEARQVFDQAGESAHHYCLAVTRPELPADDTVYRLPTNDLRQVLREVIDAVNEVAWSFRQRRQLRAPEPWRASGTDASAVRAWLPDGHMAFFELGDRGERLASLLSPTDTPVETPAVADILDAYQPVFYDPVLRREYVAVMAGRITRALRDLHDLLA